MSHEQMDEEWDSELVSVSRISTLVASAFGISVFVEIRTVRSEVWHLILTLII